MARHKDQKWNLPEGEKQPGGGSTHSWESIHSAILMDIRDELQAIRFLHERTLGCYNFTNMPSVIKRIDKRIAKKVKLT